MINFHVKIPSNWGKVLKLEQNKAKLVYFLTERIVSVATEGKQLCTALENNIVCTAHINNVHHFTRMILHCVKKNIIKTVDTDVAVLAVAGLHFIPMPKELWVDFRINKDHRYISVHRIAKALCKQKAEALPLFMHPQDVIPFRLLME